MTTESVIRAVDAMKPNSFTMEQKRLWLGELENELWRELLLQDPDSSDSAAAGRELILPAGWERVYRLYLAAMIDFGNAEFTKYANTMALYNETRQSLSAWYAERFRPAEIPAAMAKLGAVAYNDPETALTVILPEGAAVLEAVCLVTEAFDGTTNSLSLRDADGNSLLASSELGATAEGRYRRRCLYIPAPGARVLTVQVQCPGATAGRAEFSLRIQEGNGYGNSQ